MAEEVLGVFPCIVRKEATSLYITTDRVIFHTTGSTAEESLVIPLPYISGFQMNKPRPELPPNQQKALIKIQYRDEESSELRDRVIDFTGDERFGNCVSCERILRDHAGDKAEERRTRLKREQERVEASRREFLAANPDVQAMFVYLTAEGGLSVDDFWEQYRDEMALRTVPDPEEDGLNGPGAIPVPLRRPDMLESDLSANVLTVSGGRKESEITREMADEIFLQFPKAKELFEQLVPSTISEKNFWKRFFHSQYFNLSQGTVVHASSRPDQVFDSLIHTGADTRQQVPLKPGSLAVDPEIDLTSDYLTNDTGVFSFREHETDQASESAKLAHTTLISRFNRAAEHHNNSDVNKGDEVEALHWRRRKLLENESEAPKEEAELTKAEIERLRRVRPLRFVGEKQDISSNIKTTPGIYVGMDGVAKTTLDLTAELVAPQSANAAAEPTRKARKLEASSEGAEVNEYLERVVELVKFFYASKLSDIAKREKLLKTMQSVKTDMNNLLVPKLRFATDWTPTVSMINSMVSNAETLHANLSRNSIK